MPYKVITDHLRYFDHGDVVYKNELGSYSSDSCTIILTKEEVEENPLWFEEINNERWEVDESRGYYYIKNNDLKAIIDQVLFHRDQAQRIVEGLNKLGV